MQRHSAAGTTTTTTTLAEPTPTGAAAPAHHQANLPWHPQNIMPHAHNNTSTSNHMRKQPHQKRCTSAGLLLSLEGNNHLIRPPLAALVKISTAAIHLQQHQQQELLLQQMGRTQAAAQVSCRGGLSTTPRSCSSWSNMSASCLAVWDSCSPVSHLGTSHTTM